VGKHGGRKNPARPEQVLGCVPDHIVTLNGAIKRTPWRTSISRWAVEATLVPHGPERTTCRSGGARSYLADIRASKKV